MLFYRTPQRKGVYVEFMCHYYTQISIWIDARQVVNSIVSTSQEEYQYQLKGHSQLIKVLIPRQNSFVSAIPCCSSAEKFIFFAS